MDVLPILSEISSQGYPFCTVERHEDAVTRVLVYGDTCHSWENMGLCTSALTGGSFRDYLFEATESCQKNICLYLDPLLHKFSLPCYNGQGERLNEDALQSYRAQHVEGFSPDLLCNYIYLADEPAVVLYDTADTLQKKVAVAEDVGVRVLIAEEVVLSKIKTP